MEELGEKIISNVDRQFSRDHEIDEYDILPSVESTTNRNPVMVVDHKLAIEAWAARLMFCTAVEELRHLRISPLCKTDVVDRLCSLTRSVLLVVADHTTAWNIRKELIERRSLDIKCDLSLADLILTKHPKSEGTFCHRRWLLHHWLQSDSCKDIMGHGQLIEDDTHDGTHDIQSQCSHGKESISTHITHSELRHCAIRHELDVCQRAADRYSSNYYAWNHRIWVIKELACCQQQTINEELQRMRLFVTTHVSDHSGFHYRQFLLNCLTTGSSLGDELELARELIEFYPGHEAVWYHRRYIIHRLLQTDPSVFSDNAPDSPEDVDEELVAAKKTKLLFADSSEQIDCHVAVLDREKSYCSQLLDDVRNAHLSWQKTLISHHLDWIRRLSKGVSGAASASSLKDV